jgi:glycosyltransferase involved in cell wall biosynthesis
VTLTAKSEKPLTILELTHAGDVAGSTTLIFSISQRLAAAGHRVLVGCRPEALLARLAQNAGLEHVALDFRRLTPLARSLADVIANQHVDVVNSHETRDRRALTWLRWRRRLPQSFVVTRHTMPLTSPPELMAIGLSADRTIAVSHAVARGLRKRLYPSARLRVVPNGIDLARVDTEPRSEDVAEATKVLGDVAGRPVIVVLARRKDQHILLRGLATLQRPVVVAFVGIEADAQLRELTGQIPPRHRVVYVPFSDLGQTFYRLATVAALPSRIEGLSLSLLEAMAHGLPVVASDAGGNPDLIDPGETGLLVPPLEPQAWAVALERLLGDPGFAARLGLAARRLVRRDFTLERTIERTVCVYREALARRLSS